MAQGDSVHLVDGSASGAEGEQEPPRQDGRAGSMEPDLVTYRSLLYRAAHAQRALMHPFMASIGASGRAPSASSPTTLSSIRPACRARWTRSGARDS